MARRMVMLLSLAVGLITLTVAARHALADKSGRYRVTLHDNKVVEGELKETADGYEVTTKSGIQMKLRRNQVKKLEELREPKFETEGVAMGGASAAAAPGASAGPETTDPREAITDAMVGELIGSDAVDPGSIVSSDLQDLSVLPLDEPSLKEMLRLAHTGTGQDAQVLQRDHFVLVYTSSRELASQLGSRLESVYTWAHKFMRMIDLPAQRPAYKLEIFFFSSNEEYVAYGNNVGGIPSWAAGFYMQSNNRSAFYDMNDQPGIAELFEQLKRAPYRQRQFIQNRIKRECDFYNITVIQHEAAHHIHYNVGVFPKRAHTPRWLVEGLAQMFELPPGNMGGSLGATNYYRLEEFNQRWRRSRGSLVPTRQFISDDSQWNPGIHYPHGWAMVHFLWKKHREKFARYMKKIANHEEDVQYTVAQVQQEFEEIFGPADDKFHKEFTDYIFSIPRRRSAAR